MKIMKAVRIHSYGCSEVLVYEDALCPTPKENEVLIRVHASAVNSLDWRIRAGYLSHWWDYPFPLILGWDVSGVIEEVGFGVTQFKVGDAVYTLADFTRDGAYAEYIVVEASRVSLKPTSISHVQAAAVPLAGLTAWQALFDTANLKAGEIVLIHGVSGDVGTFAAQFAKYKGAKAIGTTSCLNLEFLQELGVDCVIDDNTTKFDDIVREVDVVLDTQGKQVHENSWKVLKKGGILVSVVSKPCLETAAINNVRGAACWVQSNTQELVEIAKLIDAGKVTPVIDTILPLTEVRQAHRQIQHGQAHGKVVLKVVDS
jgi:NADPH:quinone reductase-like Zn-dependent oxidoreductase